MSKQASCQSYSDNTVSHDSNDGNTSILHDHSFTSPVAQLHEESLNPSLNSVADTVSASQSSPREFGVVITSKKQGHFQPETGNDSMSSVQCGHLCSTPIVSSASPVTSARIQTGQLDCTVLSDHSHSTESLVSATGMSLSPMCCLVIYMCKTGLHCVCH